jgi:tol-pal system protein YbgF
MIPTSLTAWTRFPRAGGRAAGIAAIAGMLLLAAPPSWAQDSDLRSLADQVERLQRELSDLQRTVYSGAPAPAGSVAAGGAVSGDPGSLAANQEVRIQQLQAQMSGLTGQIEELGYQMTRLQERVDSLATAMGEMMHGGAQPPAGQPPAGQPMADGSAAPPAAADAGTTTPPATAGGASEHTFQGQIEAGTAGGEAGAATGQPQTLTPPQTAAVPGAAYQLPGNTPDEQYQYAFGLLRQANYVEAEQALRAFIERNPTSPLAGNAQYWLGETYYVRGDYQNAAVAFAEGYQKYPDSGKAPDNLLKLGMSLGEIGAKADACTALGQLDKQFPGAPANIKERAARERQRLGC